MLQKKNRDCTAVWRTGNKDHRAIRAVLMAAVCGALTLAIAQPTFGDEEPRDCASAGGNALGGGVAAPSLVQDGDRINYTVRVFNPANACLADDVSVRFWPPDIAPNNPGSICGSDNGLMLVADLTVEPGQTWKFDINGTCSYFAPDLDCVTGGVAIPALNYTVDHTDEDEGVLFAYRCAIGISHLGPIDGVAQAEGNFPTTVIHPDVMIVKSADISRICEGVETRVNYTYSVTNTSDLSDLENVVVSDNLCGPVVFTGGDTDADMELDLDETWTYTCNAFITEETTNIATVTAVDVLLGRPVMDTDTVTVFANENPSCSVDAPITKICEGDAAVQFCAIGSGGRPPYTYQWRSGETTECIDVTEADEYCVVVTDDNGCVSDPCCATLEVNENPIVEVMGNKICAGDEGGQVCAVTTGGSAPYDVLWRDMGGNVVGGCNDVDEGEQCCLDVDDTDMYCAVAVDSAGCESLEVCGNILINPNPMVKVVADSVCEGFCGNLCAVVGGGTAPYDVLWRDMGGNVVGGCNDIDEGGDCCIQVCDTDQYTAFVTDSKDCEGNDSGRLDVTEGPLCTIDPPVAEICEGDAAVEFCAMPTDGRPPYSYLWDTGETTSCIDVSVAGEYCVVVTDDNGCITECCATLVVNPNPTCSIDPPSAKICEGEPPVEFCAVPSGGQAPYFYLWNTGATTECITASSAGEYCVVITDDNGCVSDECCATLEINGNPVCSVDGPISEICDGDEAVQFCAMVSGGRPPYSYDWSNGDTTECITVSEMGEYCVTVTDDNGCVSEPCCASLDVNRNPICDITLGECPFPRLLTVNPTGGRDPYTYLWNTGETTQSISAGAAGNYSVTVTDANGCIGYCEIDVPDDCGQGGEGCTPGYWKQVNPPHDQHLSSWEETVYSPFQLFANTDSNGDGTGVFFEDAFSGLELIDILTQPASADPGPNQLNNLGRHTVAALVNAAHPDVDFGLTPLQVITMFNDVYPSGNHRDYSVLQRLFADLNEQGCPLNGHADVSGDGLVGMPDLLIVMSNWGASGLGDVNQDGIVGDADLLLIFTWWGS